MPTARCTAPASSPTTRLRAVYHAIGYKPAEAPGIAYDEHGAHLANANGDGRITTEADGGEVRDRLYATGWAKRGPVGLIGPPSPMRSPS